MQPILKAVHSSATATMIYEIPSLDLTDLHYSRQVCSH